MTKAEYDAIQSAFDSHLRKALWHYHLSRPEKNAYESAVLACKSILSKTAAKEWTPEEGSESYVLSSPI